GGHLARLDHLFEPAEVVADLAVGIAAEELRRDSAEGAAGGVVDKVNAHDGAAAGARLAGGDELDLAAGADGGPGFGAPGTDASGLVALDGGGPLCAGAECSFGHPVRAFVIQRLDALHVGEDVRELLQVAPAVVQVLGCGGDGDSAADVNG